HLPRTLLVISFFFFHAPTPTDLYPFPTRRSSDLTWLVVALECGDYFARGTEPAARLLREQAQDHIRQFSRDIRVDVVCGGWRVGDVLPDDLLRRLAVERRRAGHHLEEHGTEGIEIGRRAQVGVAEGLLGAHVVR